MLFPSLIAPDFWLLRGFANPQLLLPHIDDVAAAAPFRRMTVPGGKQMSVSMTNCGAWGWTASAKGYAYTELDPHVTEGCDAPKHWPAIPTALETFGKQAAASCGWLDFSPDTCLINRYGAGASMGLHQDRDELDLTQPIVSVSLGSSCLFTLGGAKRSDPVDSFALHSGDVLVWGGQSRLVFHGVRPLSKAVGTLRYNLTYRKAK